MKHWQYMVIAAAAGMLLAPPAAGAEPQPATQGGWMVVTSPEGSATVWSSASGSGPGATMTVEIGPAPQDAPRTKVTYLGVATSPVAEPLAGQLKLPKGVGLVVDFVDPKGPAAAAGIRLLDVLTRLDDQILISTEQLTVLVRMRKPEEKAAVTFLRDGKEEKAAVAFGENELPAGGEGGDLGGAMDPWQNVPARFRPLLARANVRAAQAFNSGSASLSDGEHSLTLTMTGGEKRLLAKDMAGKVLFDGPVTTDQQRKAVPPEILKKLDTMGRSLRLEVRGAGGGAAAMMMQAGQGDAAIAIGNVRVAAGLGDANIPPGMFALGGFPSGSKETYSDDEHTLILVRHSGVKYLRAVDKNGASVFQGPVQTAEQRKAVPPEILKKLITMEKSVRGEISTTEDGLTVTLSAEGRDQHVLAKNQDGRTVFDGAINTEDERAKMPEKVRRLVEKLWKSCAAVWSATSEE